MDNTSGNPLRQDQKEGLSLRSPSEKDPKHSCLAVVLVVFCKSMGFPPWGLMLLLKTVPGDTAARNHQLNSTINLPAAPMFPP